jgi:23S rRNA (cytidine1920-2'-O)/16S rRNA (cytidine1409-2'-O)-methyltransferase
MVNQQKVEKPGSTVASDSEVRLLGEDQRYVSRGGIKLEHALRHWKIDVKGKTCMDVGASTGGFTDCLLQHGAAHVIALDTGYGQMDARLRSDPRVRLLERTNARYLNAGYLKDEQIAQKMDLAAIDVSFISATLILPAVVQAAQPGEVIILVKPQFEVGREQVGKGGIVRDAKARQSAVEKVKDAVAALGGRGIESTDSPIPGAEGNQEYLLHARF